MSELNAKLIGKTAFVTGGGSGLGKEIAIQLARNGARLILLGTNRPNLNKTKNEIISFNGHVEWIETADFSKEGKATYAMKKLIDKYGIDILINNAGIAGQSKEVHELDTKEVHEILQVNMIAAMECANQAIPFMREKDGGSIINISSWATSFFYRNRFAYALSKSALEELTRYIAWENSHYKILCNAIAPGLIEGPRFEKVVEMMAKKAGKSPEAVEKACRSRYKLGQIATNSAIASKVISLLTDEYGKYTTGEIHRISAGFQ